MRPIRSLLCLLLLAPATAPAQSLLDRSPNVSGDWTGAPGTLYFNFVHRFSVSDAPQRKVSNVPTFLLAAGLPRRFLAGLNYSTNSTLAPRFPNEWELFARWMPISQDLGAPVDVGGQFGFNNASDGADGEVSVGRRQGPVRLTLAGRALADPFESGNVRYAVAAGATFRLGTYVALAGDVASLTGRDSSERVAWSAGLHLAIPLTPHTLSLHATNTLVTTLQGASRGTRDIRFGFEFTIPLTLRRYFGPRERSVPGADTMAAAVAADTAASALPEAVASAEAAPPAPRPARVVRNSMKNINYVQPRMQITVGTTVEWTNNDPLEHTVTASDRSFDSGLIRPGGKYRRTFTRAGTYSYFCTPHPFMKGVIVVRDP